MTRLYEYINMETEKGVGILNIGMSYQQLVTLTTENLEPGKYLIGYSWEGDFHEQKNRPFYTQLTGTFAGEEFSDSIGDNDTGFKNRFYAFPKDWAGGVITLGVQGKKDSLFSAQMDITFIDVFVLRVGDQD